MSTNEGLVGGKSPARVPAFTEKALLAIILIMFLLLHGLADAILQRTSAVDRASPAPDVQDMRLHLYD